MQKTGTRLEADVLMQPAAIRDALDYYIEHNYYDQIRALAEDSYDKIVLTGMGSSYAACINAGAMLRSAGFEAYTEVASDLLYYHMEMLTEKTLLVMVSQSGQSGELLELLARIPDAMPMAAVTNDPDSPLARRAKLTMLMHVLPEDIVSTRSYLASQILLAMFAQAYIGTSRDKVMRDLETSVNYLAETVDQFGAMREAIRHHLGKASCISLIARGWSFPTAEGGALFIKEGGKIPSIAFEAAQFRHGPVEIVEEGFCALVFIPAGICEDLMKEIAREICMHGGKVAAVVQEGVVMDEIPGQLIIRQRYVSQELAVLVNIVPVQAFIDYIALENGVDSGSFRCGSKITVKL